MKRIFVMILTIQLVLSAMTGTTVLAADNITEADEYGNVNFTDIIGEETDYTNSFEKLVTVRVYDPDNNLKWFGQTSLDDDCNLAISFSIHGKTGTYVVMADNAVFGSKTYNVGYVYNAAADFNVIKAEKDIDAMEQFFLTEGANFGFDIDAYILLSDTAKTELMTECINADDLNSEEFSDFVKELDVEGKLFDTATDAAVLDTYIQNQKVKSDSVFSSGYAKFFADMKDQERINILNKLIAYTEDDKLNNLKYETLAQYMTNVEYFMDIESIIIDTDNIWGFSSDVKTEYENCSKPDALRYIKNNISTSKNFDELEALIIRGCKNNPITYKPSYQGGGSSGGGGGGGGGGSSYTITVPAPTIAPTPTPDPNATPVPVVDGFIDMENHEWAKDAVKKLSDEQIVSGLTATTYAPALPVTREQFIALVTRGFRFTGAEYEISFKDVPQGSWYYYPIAAGVRANMIQGISADTFGVGSNITRQDAAVILNRAIASAENELAADKSINFTDESEFASYAKDSINYLASCGVINGMEDGSYRPGANITRAEAAVMIYNFFTKLGII